MSFISVNSSSSANSITSSKRAMASLGVSPIITPLSAMFSCAESSGLKPTPSSMHGATRPAIRTVPASAR